LELWWQQSFTHPAVVASVYWDILYIRAEAKGYLPSLVRQVQDLYSENQVAAKNNN